MQPATRDLGRLAALIPIGAVLAVIGPFGTFYDLGVASRFGYWMSCILLIGSFA